MFGKITPMPIGAMRGGGERSGTKRGGAWNKVFLWDEAASRQEE